MPSENKIETSLHFLFRLAQWILLIPVDGTTKNTFKWSSWKTVLTLTSTLIALFQLALYANYFLHQDKIFATSLGFVFYFTNLIYKLLFIVIARRWSKLMKKWSEMDVLMQKYVIVENYPRKMKLTAGLLFTLALGEHLFFIASMNLYLDGQTFLETFYEFFTKFSTYFFLVIPYNLYLAIFVQISTWIWLIVWTYVDVFLICLFVAFSFKLKQVEHNIARLVEFKISDVSNWKEAREHYVKLTDLGRELNRSISPLVLVSFADKIYVTLYNLLGVLSGEKYGIDYSINLVNRFYYAFCFSFILLRLAILIFFASIIDIKNQDILGHLFAVSTEAYNNEIERFIICIRVNAPIISGAKLFYIRRPLLLKITSAIIIYELVIIKYQKYYFKDTSGE